MTMTVTLCRPSSSRYRRQHIAPSGQGQHLFTGPQILTTLWSATGPCQQRVFPILAVPGAPDGL